MYRQTSNQIGISRKDRSSAVLEPGSSDANMPQIQWFCPQFGRATYQNATELIVWPTLRGFGGVANCRPG